MPSISIETCASDELHAAWRPRCRKLWPGSWSTLFPRRLGARWQHSRSREWTECLGLPDTPVSHSQTARFRSIHVSFSAMACTCMVQHHCSPKRMAGGNGVGRRNGAELRAGRWAKPRAQLRVELRVELWVEHRFHYSRTFFRRKGTERAHLLLLFALLHV